MAVMISRQIQDGWFAWVGTSSDIPRAGVILANLTHAPNANILLGLDLYNFKGLQPGEVDFHGLTSSGAQSK